MARLQAARLLAILFIPHGLRVASQLFDRTVVLCTGQIVEEGAAKALLTMP